MVSQSTSRSHDKTRVFITGATGTMGMATLREFAARNYPYVELTVLARDSVKNHKKLKKFNHVPGFRVIWGDLTNYEDVAKGVKDAHFVLHLGGMVSPAADYFPSRTLKVNVESTRNIVKAVHESGRAQDIYVVYIGSIAQCGDNRPPFHWGKTGDKLSPSPLDAYALSKIEAEREIVEGGLPHWVSLRQTGILCPELLYKGADPITFHVPLKGLLEWTTAEDSGRLMVNLCTTPLPSSFWNNFYNIGSGESYRLTNYEFECKFLKALHCPEPRKIFEPQWFSLYNFHGQWWADSDELEDLLHFRSSLSVDEYFLKMANGLPFFFRLTPLVPSVLIKWAMKRIAMKAPLGTLYWLKSKNNKRIKCHFGSIEEQKGIPEWEILIPELEKPLDKKTPIKRTDKKKTESLTIKDMQKKAEERNGECLSESMKPGDLKSKLLWRCNNGHTFEASPALIRLGGHWCPECLKTHCNVEDL